MNDLGWGWWLVMSVGMIGLWVLVIYAVVWLARASGAAASPAAEPRAPSESPRQIITRRLAAGDISVEEFERLRVVLDDAAEAPPGPVLR